MPAMKVLLLRSNTYGNRPAVGAQPYGTPYVNLADRQFGIVDPSGTPKDFIGISVFSTLANYNAGMCVVYQGLLYIANTNITAGAWNATQWTQIVIGTSGAKLPLLNGANTWSATQLFSCPYIQIINPSTPTNGLIYLGNSGAATIQCAYPYVYYNAPTSHEFQQPVDIQGGFEIQNPIRQSRIRGLTGSYVPCAFNMNSTGDDDYMLLENSASGNLSTVHYSAGSGSVGWTQPSDARIKENIEDAPEHLSGELFDKLQVRQFEFTGVGEKTIGLVAQEVQDVFPQAFVKGDEDDEKLGTPEFRAHALTWEPFWPYAIAEIKSLRNRVAEQENEIKELKERLEKIEARLGM